MITIKRVTAAWRERHLPECVKKQNKLHWISDQEGRLFFLFSPWWNPKASLAQLWGTEPVPLLTETCFLAKHGDCETLVNQKTSCSQYSSGWWVFLNYSFTSHDSNLQKVPVGRLCFPLPFPSYSPPSLLPSSEVSFPEHIPFTRLPQGHFQPLLNLTLLSGISCFIIQMICRKDYKLCVWYGDLRKL